MRVHYLQHVSFEGLGSIESWLNQENHDITCSRFYQDVDLPKIDEVDFLIIMGGPMSVLDEKQYPWLVAEKQFIKEAVLRDKPVLGICLGAQLIASALGADIVKNAEKEIGWFPVYGLEVSQASAFTFPKEFLAFHWHGETFSLPSDATLLAKSAECEHQAFQFGKKTIGLQFHLETTPQSAQSILDNCSDELVEAKCIQSKHQILSAVPERYQQINTLMADVLHYLVRDA